MVSKLVFKLLPPSGPPALMDTVSSGRKWVLIRVYRGEVATERNATGRSKFAIRGSGGRDFRFSGTQRSGQKHNHKGSFGLASAHQRPGVHIRTRLPGRRTAGANADRLFARRNGDLRRFDRPANA